MRRLRAPRVRTKFLNPVVSRKPVSVVITYPAECAESMSVENLAMIMAKSIRDMLGYTRYVKIELVDPLTGDKSTFEMGND